MKQKILLKVSMHDEKSRAKAMRIAATLPGLQSLALKGEDKKLIEVMGEDMDMIWLITSLRKKIGYAELVSVSKVEPPKPDGDTTNADKKPDWGKILEGDEKPDWGKILEGVEKPDGYKKPEGEKKPEPPCVCGWPQGYCYGIPYNQRQVWVREPGYDQEPDCTIM